MDEVLIDLSNLIQSQPDDAASQVGSLAILFS